MTASRYAPITVLLVALAVIIVSPLGGAALAASDTPQSDNSAPTPQQEVRSYLFQARLPHARALVQADKRTAARKRAKQRAKRLQETSALLAHISGDMSITSAPGRGKVVGTMPAGSRYYGVPTVAWIQRTTADGRYGEVTVPYSASKATGWIRIAGLETSRTPYSVNADLSRHTLTVEKSGDVIMTFPTGIGAPSTPTPTGRFFVTDRVPVPGGGAFGTYAFGISGIQPNLPPGWSGGDQLAIHGTDNPATIGTSTTTGCLHVSETALGQLEPLLQLGTPVTITP